jgi:hypothetical protein
VELGAELRQRFGGRDEERLTRSLAGRLGDVDRLQIAMQGWGADGAAIQQVLSGRTRAEPRRWLPTTSSRPAASSRATCALSSGDVISSRPSSPSRANPRLLNRPSSSPGAVGTSSGRASSIPAAAS